MHQQGKELKNNEYVFFCPKHGRRPDRIFGQLGINLENDKFHCYSCNFAGKTLLALFERDSREYNEYKNSLADFKPVDTKKDFEEVKLPEDFRTLSREHPSLPYRFAIKYLEERGIGKRDILMYKLGYCETGNSRGRIICPSFDSHGQMNYWTGRSFNGSGQRYANGVFDKNIIFNEYMVDWNSPIILTEGPFDAMKAGTNAIPMLGSFLDEESKLASKIITSGVDVYLALDKDAESKQAKITDFLLDYGVRCFHVPLGDKNDVGEMSHSEFLLAKSAAVEISNLKIQKLRGLC